MSPADRNLLEMAATTPLAKLASWMGYTVPTLERRLERLRLAAAADALLHPAPSPAPPERARPPVTPERKPRPTPTPRVVPSDAPAGSFPPGEPSASAPTARERGEAAEGGASAAAWVAPRVAAAPPEMPRPIPKRRQPDALRPCELRQAEPRAPIRLVPPSRFGDPRTVETLRPLTPARLRYARQFDAAGWGLAEIAWLFDADAEVLAAALRPEAA